MTEDFDLLLMDFRQALLMLVDSIERYRGMRPRTAELRRERRERMRQQHFEEGEDENAECDAGPGN